MSITSPLFVVFCLLIENSLLYFVHFNYIFSIFILIFCNSRFSFLLFHQTAIPSAKISRQKNSRVTAAVFLLEVVIYSSSFFFFFSFFSSFSFSFFSSFSRFSFSFSDSSGSGSGKRASINACAIFFSCALKEVRAPIAVI